MTTAEIVLTIAVILLAIWIFYGFLLQSADIHELEMAVKDLTRYKKSKERKYEHLNEQIQGVKGDTRLLANKLGYTFDTIPPKKSKRRVVEVDSDMKKHDIDLDDEID